MCQEGVKTRCLRALPNALSLLRLTGAATLAFLPVGAGFWAVYLLCGLSDMLDGALARRLKAESELGSKLDSLGDLAFVIVCAVRLLPGLELAAWAWAWIGIIAAVKLLCFAAAKEIPHTKLNKLTGACLFALLPVVSLWEHDYTVAFLCTVASLSAAQELAGIIRKYKCSA